VMLTHYNNAIRMHCVVFVIIGGRTLLQHALFKGQFEVADFLYDPDVSDVPARWVDDTNHTALNSVLDWRSRNQNASTDIDLSWVKDLITFYLSLDDLQEDILRDYSGRNVVAAAFNCEQGRGRDLVARQLGMISVEQGSESDHRVRGVVQDAELLARPAIVREERNARDLLGHTQKYMRDWLLERESHSGGPHQSHGCNNQLKCSNYLDHLVQEHMARCDIIAQMGQGYASLLQMREAFERGLLQQQCVREGQRLVCQGHEQAERTRIEFEQKVAMQRMRAVCDFHRRQGDARGKIVRDWMRGANHISRIALQAHEQVVRLALQNNEANDRRMIANAALLSLLQTNELGARGALYANYVSEQEALYRSHVGWQEAEEYIAVKGEATTARKAIQRAAKNQKKRAAEKSKKAKTSISIFTPFLFCSINRFRRYRTASGGV